MATEVAEAPEKSAKRIGWGLLALALASPSIMGAAGVISAARAGELTVQAGFAWLVAAVVIDLILKKRDALTKANGRIVAATLALVMALTTGFTSYRDTQKVDTAKKELIEQFMVSTVETKSAPAQPTTAAEPAPVTQVAAVLQPEPAPAPKAVVSNEADRMVGVLGAIKARAKKFAEDSGALERKFNSADLSTVLTPQNLTNKASIQASRKTLDSYKAFFSERDTLLKQHFVLSEQIIRGSSLTEREVNAGLAGLNSNKGIVVQNYADLSAAQLASVKASNDILAFAERGLGRMTVQNGQLMFQTQPELDEYQRLMQALTEVAAKEEAVTQRVNAQTQKSKQALVDEFKK